MKTCSKDSRVIKDIRLRTRLHVYNYDKIIPVSDIRVRLIFRYNNGLDLCLTYKYAIYVLLFQYVIFLSEQNVFFYFISQQQKTERP